MRVVAILAAYNEERVLGAALDNFVRQDVDFYLIDNESTDSTVAIAEQYRGRGLVGIEVLRRSGTYEWEQILKRKEELALSLEADWFIHADADEIRLPPTSGETLAAALQRADSQGFNAVNFLEFTFTPTRESPDHDHPGFVETMKWYYPFAPSFPWRLNAWKKQSTRIDLATSGGHLVKFPDLRMSPENYKMRHYLYLSVSHAVEKYVERQYAAHEVKRGWHGWRPRIPAAAIGLPPESEMRRYNSDDELDFSNPRKAHYLQELYENQISRG